MFERFSDSAGAYVVLDSANPQVYKTLFRAAKAKLKLRLKATVKSEGDSQEAESSTTEQPNAPAPAPPLVPIPTSSDKAPTLNELVATMDLPTRTKPKDDNISGAEGTLPKPETNAPLPRLFADRESRFATHRRRQIY